MSKGRKYFATRNRRYVGQIVGSYTRINEKQEVVEVPNRAKKRQMLSWAKATQFFKERIRLLTEAKVKYRKKREVRRAMKAATQRRMRLCSTK